MKTKAILLVAFVTLILIFLVFRIFSGKFAAGQNEREWYTQKLNYDFSGKVKRVEMLNGADVGHGKIIFEVTRGLIDASSEDSLNRQLSVHTSLRFLENGDGEQVGFVLMGAERFKPGDSLSVNAKTNTISIFRNGSIVLSDKVSQLLEGRGNLVTF